MYSAVIRILDMRVTLGVTVHLEIQPKIIFNHESWVYQGTEREVAQPWSPVNVVVLQFCEGFPVCHSFFKPSGMISRSSFAGNSFKIIEY